MLPVIQNMKIGGCRVLENIDLFQFGFLHVGGRRVCASATKMKQK